MQAFLAPWAQAMIDRRLPRGRTAVGWFCGFSSLAALALAGCDRGVRPEELGHIIYDARELPGANRGEANAEHQSQPPPAEDGQPSADVPASVNAPER
jgi:hypothetical protein